MTTPNTAHDGLPGEAFAASPAPTSEPSYVTAKRELDAYFSTLGITAEITGAHAAIDAEGGFEGKGWPHVAVTVTFTRNLIIGKHLAGAAVSFPYKLGVGLIDWKAIAKRTKAYDGDGIKAKRDAEAMASYGSRLTVEGQRVAASRHLPSFVAKVSPAEVLACVCRDGEDASGQSFAEWAGNYGYDEDSRKALATYEACQQGGDKARRLLSHAPGAVAKLAAFSAEL